MSISNSFRQTVAEALGHLAPGAWPPDAWTSCSARHQPPTGLPELKHRRHAETIAAFGGRERSWPACSCGKPSRA